MRLREIHSKSNPFYKQLKSILSGKGVKKYGKSLVFGRKIVSEVSRERSDLVYAVCAKKKHLSKITETVDDSSIIPVYVLGSDLFGKIDVFGIDQPFLVLRTPEIPTWNPQQVPSHGCILFVPFQDPANVGAVIRSCVGFDVTQVVLLEEAANPYHHKSIRASSGAIFKAPLYRGPSLKNLPYFPHLFGLDVAGLDIESFEFPDLFMLVPGLEGPGIPTELKAKSLRIPTSPVLESLNVVVAVSIALYEWRRRVRPVQV
ncbi:MAG: hypothetical protein JRI45_00085 [Deltaproteobacteria bacterium]|nr:hypothetical protein [Deltaproteobacteria bacterium]MBW2067998.1 hypothetical protein [Deltaproteobacteria bacterium]